MAAALHKLPKRDRTGFSSYQIRSKERHYRNKCLRVVKIRLTKKFAECIDGVVLSGRRVGDVIDFPPEEARLLVAHDWAVPAEPKPPEVAAERSPRRADSRAIRNPR